MTEEGSGLTEEGPGLTDEGSGLTDEGSGWTDEGSGGYSGGDYWPITIERIIRRLGSDHHGFDVFVNGADWFDAEFFDQYGGDIRCQELG